MWWMAILLERVRTELLIRLRHLDDAVTRHLISPAVSRRIDRSAIQEGYISAVWQTWSAFCRRLFIESARGGITSSGTVITSPYHANSEMEIAFVALRLSHNEPIKRLIPLKGSHLEPSWGDVGKAQLIAAGLGTSNANTIASALSASIRLNDLQLCRNASAHLSASLLADIRSRKVRYLDTTIMHPSDMAFWVDPTTKDFLWRSWLEEMEIISDYAIR